MRCRTNGQLDGTLRGETSAIPSSFGNECPNGLEIQIAGEIWCLHQVFNAFWILGKYFRLRCWTQCASSAKEELVCIASLCRNIHPNYSGVAFELVTAILSGCVIYLNGTSTAPKALRNLQFLNALGEGKK